MGLLDKAKKLAGGNKDKVASGVDKATDAIDSKTGGKHRDNLEKVDRAAADYAGDPTDAAAPGSVAGHDAARRTER